MHSHACKQAARRTVRVMICAAASRCKARAHGAFACEVAASLVSRVRVSPELVRVSHITGAAWGGANTSLVVVTCGTPRQQPMRTDVEQFFYYTNGTKDTCQQL